MNIVVLDKENFLADFPKMLFDCVWEEYLHTDPDEIIVRLANADIAVTHKTVLNESHFKQLPNLKMITTNSTGYNTIDAEAAKRYGIKVCNVQDWCTNSVIEHVLAFIFALKRNIMAYHTAIKQGEWERQSKGSYAILHAPAHEISGSTIGIFGHGTLGKHLENKVTALGMSVLLAERKSAEGVREGYTRFNEVLANSDVIVLLSPLNTRTYKMIGIKEMNQMKPGAAIDVLEQEPPAGHHPLLKYDGNNLLLSSHVAFASQESIASNTGQIVANIERFYSGSPQNVVN